MALFDKSSHLYGFHMALIVDRMVACGVLVTCAMLVLMKDERDNWRLMERCTPKGKICPKFLSFPRMDARCLTLYVLPSSHFSWLSRKSRSSFLSCGY